MHEGILDYRQVIGYLAIRPDVDSKRLGLIGNSMGAMMGAILTGVDDRIKYAALSVGGDPIRLRIAAMPPEQRNVAESISPSNYIGHIAPRPTYLINALQDETMNEAASKLLLSAAKEPKTIVWVKSGHVLPPDERQKPVAWLTSQPNRQ